MPSVAEASAAVAARREPGPKPHRERSQEFYASSQWRRLRYAVLRANAQRNGGAARCELCKSAAAPGSPLHCDHIEPLSKNWARRLDPGNVQVLCADCNMGKSNRDAIDWRAGAIDEAPCQA
jgi:5-methylcytosine-specific restriction endonuclease McrA